MTITTKKSEILYKFICHTRKQTLNRVIDLPLQTNKQKRVICVDLTRGNKCFLTISVKNRLQVCPGFESPTRT